jgi:hypothetical protein
MSCNPNPPPCNCTNPSIVGIIVASSIRVDTFTVCRSCTQPLAGFIVIGYFGQIATDCRQLCIESINAYWNVNLLEPAVGGSFVTCADPIPINIIPADLDVKDIIPCTLAPFNDLCREISRNVGRFGLVACLTDEGVVFEPIGIFFTFNQNGTDSNGLTSIQVNVFAEHPCIGRRLLFVIEICFRNYSPVPDVFNVKEDYEVLKGLTVGTNVWELDQDIHTMRKMRIIPS